jgi:Pup amidohydrolase
MTTPPEDTRAWFRGRCLDRFRGDIVAAGWDALIFDVGQDALQRIPMMDPDGEPVRTSGTCWTRWPTPGSCWHA